MFLSLLLATATLTLAADPPAPDLPPQGPEKSAVTIDPATATATELHERRFRYLSIRDLTLEQAVELIRKSSHANFVVEMWRLEEAGFDPKRTIRLYLEDISWDAAFDAMLSAYGREVPIALGERNDRQILVISTPEAASDTFTRIYDVRQIVEYIQSAQLGRPLGPRQLDPEEEGLLTKNEAVEQVVRLLQETVDPDGWRDNGGSKGAVRELACRLIVTQTPANHKQIEKYLKNLEQELGRPMPPAAATQPAATQPTPERKP
jgi:hypothetical protein